MIYNIECLYVNINNACNYINTEFPYTVSDSESIFDQTPDICSDTMNLVECPDVTQISVTTTVSTSSTFSFSSILVTPSSVVACEGSQCDGENRNSSQLLLIAIAPSISFAVVVILISAGIICIFVIYRREIRKSTQKGIIINSDECVYSHIIVIPNI